MLGLQHVVTLDIRLQHIAVAPPRGVRGLKSDWDAIRNDYISRTPSWGAWIEIALPASSRCPSGRTPSWGAWIEIPGLQQALGRITSHPLVGCVD